MSCKFDPDTGSYLIDGQPCKTDNYGDPTHHCTARRTCSQHIAKGELVCPRCIGRTRTDITWTATLATLMLPAAIDNGINTPAAYLAAPAANPEHVRNIRFYIDAHATHHYRTGRINADTLTKILSALPDEDTWHPYSVTTRWQLMLSEDYHHPLPTRFTTAGACAYLDRHLHRVAQDPQQDFALLARDMRTLHQRLETVLRNSTKSDLGVPCPDCLEVGHLVRLAREYSHWCWDPECRREHHPDDSADTWRCPRDSQHFWSHAWYIGYIEERMSV